MTTGRGNGSRPSDGEKRRKLALLEEAKSLTSIARTGWITLLLGCLYAWLTLAALDDVDFFLPERTFRLPIIGADISAAGFFLFAPFLLLALFLYFLIMLARLLKCYGKLRQIAVNNNGRIDGLSVEERVEPWFLTTILRRDARPLDRLGQHIVAALAWAAAPATIVALGYRYMRAHDIALTALHCAVAAVACTAGVLFYKRSSALLSEAARYRLQDSIVAASGGGIVFGAFIFFAFVAINSAWHAPASLRFLSPHARLMGTELSRPPEEWDIALWQRKLDEIEILEDCWPNLLDIACPESVDALLDRLKTLRSERDFRIRTVEGVQLGHVPAPRQVVDEKALIRVDAHDAPDPNICDDWPIELIGSARDLRQADLRAAYLANAGLTCAYLEGADLRDADLMGANLERARMSEVDLSRARLEGAKLANAILLDATLVEVQMDATTLLSGAWLDGADLEGADLFSAHLVNASMRGTNLLGADLRKTVAARTDFGGANLAETDLSGANLLHANLGDANISGASFYGRRTAMSHAVLAGAALREIDLSLTDIEADQVASAFGDSSARLRDGVVPPGHWPEFKLRDEEFYGIWQGWRKFCGLPAIPSEAIREWLEDQEFVALPWTVSDDRNEVCPSNSEASPGLTPRDMLYGTN